MAMDDVDKREDEIELELGLSLGGNCNTRLQKFISVQKEAHERKFIPELANLGFGVQACTRFGELSGFMGANSEQDMDPKMKREIQAMRRQEAKKKRGEKQLKMALTKGKLTAAIGCSYPANAVYLNGVSHHDPEEHECKRRKSINFSVERLASTPPTLQRLSGPTSLQFSVPAHGVGRTESRAIPCWFVGGGFETNLIRPVHVCVEPCQGVTNVHDSEQHGDEGRGGSSESISHSMLSILEQPQFNGTGSSRIKIQLEQTATSDLIESASEETNCIEAIKAPSNDAQPDDPHSSLSKRSNQQVGCNLPKSSNQHENDVHPTLPYMPCVLATRNVPNGKTVHGFLYEYTKGEASIICVCHGSSFSPMEFVQHAGGIDVSHPMKHITVVPPTI
ncbi:unnamed protein product [Linum tenue]|uniref:Ninja-family protein n=1 Tax=Linum tenue TaxID=586396 RepID=A0AAV0RV31_9ROSI|nr:unnamed protein product [Linum tenue]